jgi:hypothetical protein
MSDEQEFTLTGSERKRPAMKGAGRPVGALNKFTRELKEAMFSAAENSVHAKDQNNPDAPGSVTQFLTNVADRYPVQFMQALMKFVPQQYKMERTELRAEMTYSSADEIKRALQEEGFSPKHIEAIEAMLPAVGNVVEVEDHTQQGEQDDRIG